MARYQAYSSGEVTIKTARAAVQAEKYRAMAQIASSSTSFLGLGGMIPAAPITVVTPAVTVDRPVATTP